MNDLSMTPPQSPVGFMLEDLNVSPVSLQGIEDGRSTCFTCAGEVNPRTDHFHDNSYWKTRFLSRVFSKEEVWSHSQTVNMFSHRWQQWNILTDHLDKLFLFMRQNIGEIQSYTNNSMFTDAPLDRSLLGKRMHVTETLDLIWGLVKKNTSVDMEVLENLIGKLHNLLLHIGRLTDLPSHVTITTACDHGNKSNSGLYHCFHLHLDVYWRVLAILYTMEWSFPDFQYSRKIVQSVDLDVDFSLFDQMVQLVLWDLVAVTLQRYVSKVSNGDYTKVVIYSCTCVKELWLLVLKLLEMRCQRQGGQSFWVSMHQIFVLLNQDKEEETDMDMDIDSDVFMNPPDLPSCKDHVCVCLWMMANLAPLFNIESADPNLKTKLQSNYHDLEYLIKKSLQQPSLPEARLRHHLKSCLQLSSLWEPNTGILVILWEYYYRRLNNTFQLSTLGVEGLASINQSVAGLFHQCKKFVMGQPGNDHETSFQLFLRLMALHLGRLYSDGSVQEWKQMKGRFYSKFHQRRIQHLAEGGLYNLTSLFLTLAMATDMEDVGAKLCDFYDMLDYSKISAGKRSVIWRGAFTLMLINVEKQLDVGFLAQKMALALESAIREFKADSMDTHNSLWKLILIYLEGTQEVFDASQSLQLSEHKLVCPGLKSLLTACSENELRTALSILQSLVYRFKQVCENNESSFGGATPVQHSELADAVWNNIYPFVRDHSVTLTPPPQLADLAAGICLMALKMSQNRMGNTAESQNKFVAVFQYFALDESVNTNISCRFLGHMLSMREVTEQLQCHLSNYQTVVIKAWFKCVLHIPDGSQLLTEVTRPVLQLEDVRSMFTTAEMALPESIEKVPVHFLKAIDRTHRKLENWKDRLEFRDRVMSYFCDVSKHVAMVVKNHGPSEAFSNVYKMAGLLVKCCAPLLFVESRQDCPLPSIVNSMIVPHHVLNPEKPLQSSFVAVIRDTLHLFVQGLAKLDFKKSPYVQRKLKDIFAVYLPKFALKSSTAVSVATYVHPLVASLSNSFAQQVTKETLTFRQYILQLVIDNFIAVKNMTVHPAHALGISFILEVVQRTTSTGVLARDTAVLLPWCLDYLLLLPDSSAIYTHVVTILQAVLDAFVSHSCPILDLVPASECFIKTFFKFSSEGVLQVMEKLAVLHKEFVISVIKKLSNMICELEAKRGIGIDKRLRQKYFCLLKMLGPKGQEEMDVLQ